MSTVPLASPQPAIFEPPGPAGYSLEFDVCDNDLARNHPEDALRALLSGLPARAVVGLGQPLVAALGTSVPGLRPLETLSARATLVARQRGAWVLISADSPSEAYDRASTLVRAATPGLVVVEQTPLFRYRTGHDLMGYEDGTANPVGAAAVSAAVVPQGPLAGSSFAFAQRFVHDLTAFHRLDDAAQDAVIGRARGDNHEIDSAPESAHVKRTAQELFSPEAFILRRSLPWGDLTRSGLQFVAFARELRSFDVQLRRMVGADGPADALLRYTRAETGGYYWCPPTRNGEIDLSAIAR